MTWTKNYSLTDGTRSERERERERAKIIANFPSNYFLDNSRFIVTFCRGGRNIFLNLTFLNSVNTS